MSFFTESLVGGMKILRTGGADSARPPISAVRVMAQRR